MYVNLHILLINQACMYVNVQILINQACMYVNLHILLINQACMYVNLHKLLINQSCMYVNVQILLINHAVLSSFVQIIPYDCVFCRCDRQSRDLSYCLSLLPYTDKCLRKLLENIALFADKLADADVYKNFTTILANGKKFAKVEAKVDIVSFLSSSGFLVSKMK